jgi:phthalate 4,5-dioxygenase
MGDVLRSYWLPVLLSDEIERDAPPLRIRLLGEDLVAFRDSHGQTGLLGAQCPHRGASLFFGRNEEQGLRCVYHGWKFDIAGRCLEMPNEPPDSNFRDKVHHTSYPCRERKGVVWAHLGDGHPPELPSLEWNLVPETQRHITKRVQRSNWVQAVEGGIDPSHSGFLHAPLRGSQP